MLDPADFPPPPRRLRRCRGYARLVTHAVMLIVISMFAQVFWMTNLGVIRVLWFSREVPATITRIVVTPAGERGNIHDMDLTYRVDGVEYTNRVRVSAAEAEVRKEGDAMQARFVPERPDVAQPIPENYPVVLVTVFCGFLASAPFFAIAKLLWELFVAPWRQRQLLRSGSVTTGVVVHRSETKGRGAMLRLTYEYEVLAPDTGELPRGTDTVRAKLNMPGTDFVGRQVGDQVIVIYAPDRPRRSVLYEYADYEFAASPVPV